jgi:hypothetical protein
MAHTEAHSYVCGTAVSPLSDLTIAASLAEPAARFPERLAVVFREHGVRWNWKQLANEIETFAAVRGLASAGVILSGSGRLSARDDRITEIERNEDSLGLGTQNPGGFL